MVEKALRVRLPNQPGQLARLAGMLGEARVNVRAIAAVGGDEATNIEILVDDRQAARQVLQAGGVTFAEVEVALVSLPHRPGSLARAARRVAEAGLNIDSVYIVATEGERAQVAFGGQAEGIDQVLAELETE